MGAYLNCEGAMMVGLAGVIAYLGWVRRLRSLSM